MATKTVTAPAVIKIVNNATTAKVFAPYRENFVTTLAAGATIELQVKTSGQVLYYLGQASKDLAVSVLADFDSTEGAIKITSNEKITITNSSNRVIGFIPYKENFQFDIAAGDVVELTATNVGTVLYYLAQATTGLTVAHEKIETNA